MSDEEKEKQLGADAIELPIVDISTFVDAESSTANERQDVINKIECGFSNFGFILLKGHNLDKHSLSSAFDINKKLFTEIPKELLSSTIIQSPVPRGYAPINTENFAALIGNIKPNDLNCKYRIGPEQHSNIKIKVHKNNKQIKINYNQPDRKQNDESLDVLNDELLDPYYGTKGARCLLYPNIWPTADMLTDDTHKNVLKQFKMSLMEMYDELYKIAQILFDIFETIFVDKLEYKNVNFNKNFNKHTSILSTNYYPTKSEIKTRYNVDIKENDFNQKRMAISEHTDIDIFTIIVQNNNEGGVQIRLNNEWLSIPYDEDVNYLVVNVGDGFQYLTKNKWKSTKHRVLIPENNKSRQVFAFFAALNYDAMMKPLMQRTHKNENSENNDIVTYYNWRKKRIKKVVQQLKKIKIKQNK